VNPFALGAAFVERAVELGWVEVDSDGRRSSYYLTDSGNEGLENFGVKIEKAMHFTIIPERDNSAPRRRASSSMQAHRGSMPSHRGSMSPHGVRHDRPRNKGHERGERHERHEGPRMRRER
jgi:hypothetical protein